MSRWYVALGTCVWCALAVSCARAQADSVKEVPVVMETCEVAELQLLGTEVLALLAVELAPAELRSVAPERAVEQALWLRLCGPRVSLGRWSSHGPEVTRELTLSELERATRARTLALLLSALAARKDKEPLAEPVPAAASEPATTTVFDEDEAAQESGIAKSRKRERTLRFELALDLRTFMRPFTTFSGPALGLSWARWQTRSFAVLSPERAAAERGQSGIAALSLGYAVVRARLVRIAPRGELGVTWLQGRAFQAGEKSELRALWAAGMLDVTVQLLAWSSSSLQLSLGIGYARGLATRVDRRLVTTSHGPCGALSAFVSFGP